MHYFIVRELVNSQYRNGKLLHRRAESQNGITHILNIKLHKNKNTHISHKYYYGKKVEILTFSN